MSDLINRDDAIRELKEMAEYEKKTGYPVYAEAIANAAERLKIIRKVRVTHAHWISKRGADENGNALYTCSNCLRQDEHSESTEVPYCWYCGARMIGDDPDGEN